MKSHTDQINVTSWLHFQTCHDSLLPYGFFKRKCFPKDSLPSVVVNLDSLPWLLFVSQASSYPMAYLPSAKSISRMLKITHCVTAIVMSQEVK